MRLKQQNVQISLICDRIPSSLASHGCVVQNGKQISVYFGQKIGETPVNYSGMWYKIVVSFL